VVDQKGGQDLETGFDHLSERVVAVGVDESPESTAAARYAVRAANDRGLDLLLVHAYLQPNFTIPVDQRSLDACREPAERLVRQVAAQLVLPNTMRILADVQPQMPASLLLEVARRVPLLVVGQDHPTWDKRLLFGRVAAQVAQRSDCPVAVVPSGWRLISTDSHHPVVIALEGTSPARPALLFAFKQAVAAGSRLVALHVTPYRSRQADITERTASLTELLAGWKQDYPGVNVDVLVVRGDEEESLLRWSNSAAAVVVERPHWHWWNPWTHSMIGTVLSRTPCPLIIVPQESTTPR
jgi:nucleotide-binding universal stress UspA family protein